MSSQHPEAVERTELLSITLNVGIKMSSHIYRLNEKQNERGKCPLSLVRNCSRDKLLNRFSGHI